jgi:hypothetical protein
MEQRRRLHLVAFSQGHLAEGDIDTLQEHFIGRGEPSHAQSEGLCSCIAVAKPNRHHGAGQANGVP